MSKTTDLESFLLDFKDKGGNKVRCLDVVELTNGLLGIVKELKGDFLVLNNESLVAPMEVEKILSRNEFELTQMRVPIFRMSDDTNHRSQIFVNVLLTGSKRQDIGTETHHQVLFPNQHGMEWIKQSYLTKFEKK